MESVLNTWSATVVLAVIVFCLAWFWNKRSAGSPPGPSAIELLCGIISSRKFLPKLFQQWSKTHGPLFMCRVGSTNLVVINSSEVANEAFIKNDCFNDRPQSIALLSDGLGLVMINQTSFQKEQRRFTLNTLREFGMGRKNLEPHLTQIVGEVSEIIDEMCNGNGVSQPFDMKPLIYEIAPKVTSYIVFGHDVGKDNKGFQFILRRLMGLEPTVENDKVKTVLMSVIPFLKHFPIFYSTWKKGQQFQSIFYEEVLKEVQNHRESSNVQSASDYIDCFMKEMDKFHQLGTDRSGIAAKDDRVQDDVSTDWKPRSSFHEKQLIAAVRDLYIAGSETTSTALKWIFLYMCKYLDVQRKMHDEIDGVLGQSGTPSMAMVDKLSYVWAVIQEVSRMCPIVPLSLPHLASRDGKLQGYHIPKGSFILTNIWAIHHDENIWSEPERFLPERHLDENGKFVKSPHHMIFNIGARSCLGLQLANTELFFTIVILLQRFEFTFPPGFVPNMDGSCGITYTAAEFDVIAKRR